MDYRELYRLEENLHIEFKLATTKVPLDFYETYSAFANTDGGDIYLGVEEESEKVKDLPGIANWPIYQKTILDAIASKDKCSRSALDDSSFEAIPLPNGRFVLKVHVNELPRNEKPLYLNGDFTKAFIRRGSGDYLASKSQLISFLNDVRQGSYDFSINSSGLGIESIEKESLHSFRRTLQERNPFEIDASLSDEEFLLATKMLRESDGKKLLTNGAVLMLGTSEAISIVYPAFFLDYQENPREGSRYDYRLCSFDSLNHCNIFDFFTVTRSRARSFLPSPYELNNGQEVSGERMLEAFTEALVNGLCNADYLNGSSLLLTATPKEMLFRNSGKPYIPIEDMIAGGTSEPRNTEIMRYFRLLRFSQRTGYGVSNIFAVMKDYGYPTPSLSVHSSPDFTELRLFFFGRGIQSGSTKLSVSEVLSAIASQNGISQKELTERFGVTRKTMMTLLNALLAGGQIRTNAKKTKGRLYFIQGIKPYGE